MNEKRAIRQMLFNLCNGDFDRARQSLQQTINIKVTARYKNAVSNMISEMRK